MAKGKGRTKKKARRRHAATSAGRAAGRAAFDWASRVYDQTGVALRTAWAGVTAWTRW